MGVYWGQVPTELRYPQSTLLLPVAERWLQDVCRPSRRWWERAWQYIPWYESPDGRLYKVVRLGLFGGSPTQIFVVDHESRPASDSQAEAALRTLRAAQHLSTLNYQLYFFLYSPVDPENRPLRIMEKWREMLERDPRGQNYLPALDHVRKSEYEVIDMLERATRLLVEGLTTTRRMQEHIRGQRWKSVVRHGEAEAAYEALLRNQEIFWHLSFQEYKKHRHVYPQLQALFRDADLLARLAPGREELRILKEALQYMKPVARSSHKFAYVDTNPCEYALREFERAVQRDVRALATPQ